MLSILAFVIYKKKSNLKRADQPLRAIEVTPLDPSSITRPSPAIVPRTWFPWLPHHSAAEVTEVERADGYLVPVDRWEIPRRFIILNEMCGEGCFGKVFKAEIRVPHKTVMTVAVKTLKGLFKVICWAVANLARF